jgi:hypothetical protein
LRDWTWASAGNVAFLTILFVCEDFGTWLDGGRKSLCVLVASDFIDDFLPVDFEFLESFRDDVSAEDCPLECGCMV